jgi:hypothetical protein
MTRPPSPELERELAIEYAIDARRARVWSAFMAWRMAGCTDEAIDAELWDADLGYRRAIADWRRRYVTLGTGRPVR